MNGKTKKIRVLTLLVCSTENWLFFRGHSKEKQGKQENVGLKINLISFIVSSSRWTLYA